MPNYYDCPKYERCNANLCPLDEISSERTMDRDEQVCHYLCEVSKNKDPSLYEDKDDAAVYIIASSRLNEMTFKSKALKRRLERTSKTHSRLAKKQLELDL